MKTGKKTQDWTKHNRSTPVKGIFVDLLFRLFQVNIYEHIFIRIFHPFKYLCVVMLVPVTRVTMKKKHL